METTQYKDMSLKINQSAGRQDRVIKAQMELTYRCNLHCRHCYTDPYNKQEYFSREMSTAEIKRILDEMAEYGILWLNFTGGEAMARKDFFEIYEYAVSKGFIVVIYSNGTVFTEESIERLKKNPPFLIDISCHSVKEQSFDWFTKVPGSFQRFLYGMKLLKSSGLPFDLKTKAMTWNKDEMQAIRNFYESLGFEFYFSSFISPRLDGDCSPLEYRLSAEKIDEIELREGLWEEEESSCGVVDEMNDPTTDRLYRCGCGTNTIHINAWAELGTCALEYEARASLRHHSLIEAIHKVFDTVRRLRYQNNESECRFCKLYVFCEKSPSQARWEVYKPENPVPWHCDRAHRAAERLTKQTWPHPLFSKPQLSKTGEKHDQEALFHP